jgi:beta-1,3-galactosyltransferase 1/2/3/4/5/7/8
MKDHVEGYHKLTAKTKKFFTTALTSYDADFYVKVDDDVHVNLGLCSTSCLEFFLSHINF